MNIAKYKEAVRQLSLAVEHLYAAEQHISHTDETQDVKFIKETITESIRILNIAKDIALHDLDVEKRKQKELDDLVGKDMKVFVDGVELGECQLLRITDGTYELHGYTKNAHIILSFTNYVQLVMNDNGKPYIYL